MQTMASLGNHEGNPSAMPSHGEATISIKDVSKTFRSRGSANTVLEDINLEISDREFIVLLGPSGCGKSTLLRIIGQLLPPTTGHVSVRGIPSKTQRKQTGDGSLGFVFQQPNLLPWRTVERNVELPLEIQGVPKAKRSGTSKELLELVGLGNATRKLPAHLSGGMAQRVSIARALAVDPKVLLMDEPFGALDAQTRDDMAMELQSIWMRKPTTVIFVTHSISEAVLLADRIVVLGGSPGTIDSIHDVPFPRPRDMEITESQEFYSLVRTIRRRLKDHK